MTIIVNKGESERTGTKQAEGSVRLGTDPGGLDLAVDDDLNDDGPCSTQF
jgi:hypothetical protein